MRDSKRQENDFRAFTANAKLASGGDSAAASVYLECLGGVEVPEANSTDEISKTGSTKVVCSIYGPLQKALSSDVDFGSMSKAAHIAVELVVNDDVMFSLHSKEKEDLDVDTASLPSGSVQFAVERRVKTLKAEYITAIKQVLDSVVLKEKYPNSQIVFQFQVIEVEGSLVQFCLQAAAVALLNSAFECRCLPITCCVALSQSGHFLVDPTLRELDIAAQAYDIVYNPETEEVLHMGSTVRHRRPIGLEQLESLVGLGVSACKEMREYTLTKKS